MRHESPFPSEAGQHELENERLTISTFCFAVALFFYIYLHDYILPDLISNSTYLKLTIEFLSSISIYALLYQLTTIFYDSYLFKIVKPDINIGGNWFQVFTSGNGASRVIRHGPCLINSRANEIKISATNFNINREVSSSWNSETVYLKDNKLVISFVSEGKSRKIPIKRGSMVFNLHGTPPQSLSGTFYDLTPGSNYGDIHLFRNKDNFEEHLKKAVSCHLQGSA